jgi:hypothetical protein
MPCHLARDDHVSDTRRLGGSPDVPGLRGAVDVRWPGYLGSRAFVGNCVVAVANIHTTFVRGNVTPPVVDSAIAAARSLRDSDYDEAAELYRSAIREMYGRGLARRGGWTVFKWFDQALSAIGLADDAARVESIVYLNVSCCQFPEPRGRTNKQREIDYTTKRQLQAECLATHPLADMIAELRPRLVLCTSQLGFDHLVECGLAASVPTLCFNQHPASGVLTRDAAAPINLRAGASPEEWCARLTALAA